MVSLFYGLTLGAIGLIVFALYWGIFDQVILGELWRLGVDWELNGTYLTIFRSMHIGIPAIVVFVFFIGNLALAHFRKNE